MPTVNQQVIAPPANYGLGTQMNRYGCTACGMEKVARLGADEVDMVCCKGDTRVKHKKIIMVVKATAEEVKQLTAKK